MNYLGPAKLLVMELYLFATLSAAPAQSLDDRELVVSTGDTPILILINNFSITPTRSATVQRLEMLSGLTRTRLAELLGVDRRTLYYWLDERPVSEENARRLTAAFEMLDSVGPHPPEQIKRALLTVDASGISALEAFRNEHDAEARERLALGLALALGSSRTLGISDRQSLGIEAILRVKDDDLVVPLSARARRSKPVPIASKAPRRI